MKRPKQVDPMHVNVSVKRLRSSRTKNDTVNRIAIVAMGSSIERAVAHVSLEERANQYGCHYYYQKKESTV